MPADFLPKEYHDALIIVRFDIRRTVPKSAIQWLTENTFIVPKDGGGWMATSKGREYVRRLR